MTATDQRGEQTINRDAKTLGNFTFFILKMNSHNQIDWTQNLLQSFFVLFLLSKSPTPYFLMVELKVSRQKK